MKFIPGRLQTGYEKLVLLKNKFFDIHILRIKTGGFIPPHVDPIPGYRHWRLNFILWDCNHGGILSFRGIPNFRRFQMFRSDTVEHKMSMVLSGTKYILSIGFWRAE